MARKFRGEFLQKVDGKGRVSIPAQFRRTLEQSDPNWRETPKDQPSLQPDFVIVYGDHRRNFLECYSIEAIEEVDERISAMKRGSMKRRMLERMFSGQSMQTTVDDTGRIVLTKKLREKIGIEDEAFFIATGDTFQIWKPETYEAEELAKTEQWLEELPDNFDVLELLDEDGDD